MGTVVAVCRKVFEIYKKFEALCRLKGTGNGSIKIIHLKREKNLNIIPQIQIVQSKYRISTT